jgi:hypothetical protein
MLNTKENTKMENQNKPLDWHWTHIMTNTKTGEHLYIRQDYWGRLNPTNSYTLVKDGVALFKTVLRRPAPSKTWELTEDGELLKDENWGRDY